MTTARHRLDFGKDWDEVIQKWGDSNTLPITSEQGWEDLGALEKYWPEYLDEVLATGQKGIYTLAQVIDTGLILAACQHLRGFEKVLEDDLKKRKRVQDFLAELRFASALVDLGYQPLLSMPSRLLCNDRLYRLTLM